MTQEPQTIIDSLELIGNMIRTILVIQPADVEDIKNDIWLYCKEKNLHPSYTLTRNICYDWLRRKYSDAKALKGYLRYKQQATEEPVILSSTLEQLLTSTDL